MKILSIYWIFIENGMRRFLFAPEFCPKSSRFEFLWAFSVSFKTGSLVSLGAFDAQVLFQNGTFWVSWCLWLKFLQAEHLAQTLSSKQATPCIGVFGARNLLRNGTLHIICRIRRKKNLHKNWCFMFLSVFGAKNFQQNGTLGVSSRFWRLNFQQNRMLQIPCLRSLNFSQTGRFVARGAFSAVQISQQGMLRRRLNIP